MLRSRKKSKYVAVCSFFGCPWNRSTTLEIDTGVAQFEVQLHRDGWQNIMTTESLRKNNMKISMLRNSL